MGGGVSTRRSKSRPQTNGDATHTLKSGEATSAGEEEEKLPEGSWHAESFYQHSTCMEVEGASEGFGTETSLFQYEIKNDDSSEGDGSAYDNLLFEEEPPESLSRTAMSFDMDDNDLLFNLLYFNDNPEGFDAENIGAVYETAVTETIAAHSEGNTPYKLRPASEKVQVGLEPETLDQNIIQLDCYECAICKDEMEDGCHVSLLKKCRHCFHSDCILRWIKLQGWCPICRMDIDETQLGSEIVQNNEEVEVGKLSGDERICRNQDHILSKSSADSPVAQSLQHSTCLGIT